MMEKILITGISGMLGKAMYQILNQSNKYTLYGVSRKEGFTLPGVEMIYGDLSSQEFTKKLNNIKFHSIIHCSAEVNVSLCETNHIQADKSNIESTKNVFLLLNSEKKIYISTDAVFDGQNGDYSEDSFVNPLNYYAKTKFQGENIVRELCNNFYIIRTNIYGFNTPMRNSLFEWAYTELSKGEKINGFSNMYFNPLYVSQLAKCIESIVSSKIEYGTYNISADEYLSKYDFLICIANAFGFSKELIIKKEFDQNEFKAVRALNSTLKNSKFKEVLHNFDFSIANGLLMLKSDFNKLEN